VYSEHPPVDVVIVIPALDEAAALPAVLTAIRREGAACGYEVRAVLVADNGSSDGTGEVATRHGAVVVVEPRRGYGAACLAALAALRAQPPDVVAFLDADGSSDPAQLPRVLAPLRDGHADLVIGSRTRGCREAGSLTPVQVFGNALASALLRLLWRARTTDLGPFRAIRWPALARLGMRDRDYGWTVEMQARAARAGLRVIEVPVDWRRRTAGRSKVSGTVRGVVGAGWKILFTIARVRLGG
jgi:glycosyltransferase involved in cell wall biosynthesis